MGASWNQKASSNGCCKPSVLEKVQNGGACDAGCHQMECAPHVTYKNVCAASIPQPYFDWVSGPFGIRVPVPKIRTVCILHVPAVDQSRKTYCNKATGKCST